jgi:thiamine-monophosphate kinase
LPSHNPWARALSAMTEDSLVAALREICEARASDASPGPRKIVLGIGDDAAAWQPSRSHLSVITTDALVDGVHFRSAAMDAGDIGHRAMAANLSDIAAMGARPVLATIALGVTPDTSETWLRACYTAMAALAHAHGARIVGGDITASPVVSLAITVVGEVSRTRMKTRAGGRPGDVLAVTGPLGASRAGLELLRRGGVVGEGDDERALGSDERRAAERAFARPTPRMREGRFLAASSYVHAMMDSSDGLSTDVARLARASGCGATLDEVPIHLAAFAVAEAVGDDPARYALDGGEDFELIIAVAPRAFEHLARKFALAFGASLVPIGRLDAELGVRTAGDGITRELVAAGFDHFSPRIV